MLEEAYDTHVPFLFFAGVTSFLSILIYLLVPETEGKSLEEIQMELRGETPPPERPEKLPVSTNDSKSRYWVLDFFFYYWSNKLLWLVDLQRVLFFMWKKLDNFIPRRLDSTRK